MSAALNNRDGRRGVRGRAVGLVAGVAIAAVALTSCGTVPGAAVSIDGTRFSEGDVQQRTQSVIDENAPVEIAASIDPLTRALLNRYQVTDLIRHELTQEAAKAENLDIDEAKVNGFIAGNGGVAKVAANLNVPASEVQDAAFDYLVLNSLVATIPDVGVEVTNVTVTIDAVLADDRAAAVAARTKYLNDPAAMDGPAAAAFAAGTAPGGDESLIQSSHDAVTGIFSAPEGEILIYPASGGGFFVVRVTKRVEQPATLTQDIVNSAQSLNGYIIVSSLLLRKYAMDRDIQVNPRYGEWDAKTLQVVPANSGL